ncbi:hypothetical protein BDW59DRAFT_148764 [Aspergillus cavernicola]|uniref:Uncharacterized protein n=1 Tax=Aspergillus cavernicola TaxID=176166 RepID=A0ABR4I6H5_9EURO
MLRSLLADRYGKDFMALASENKLADVKVPERLAKGLRVRPPSAELVESYLREIARAYKISWGDSHLDDIDHEEGGDGGSGGGDLGLDIGDQKDGSERTELTRATPPRGVHAHQLSGKSPVSIAPPGPRSDNPNPRVKVPGDNNNNNNNDDSAEMGSPSPSQRGRDRSGGIPELDELTRRFAALKR